MKPLYLILTLALLAGCDEDSEPGAPRGATQLLLQVGQSEYKVLANLGFPTDVIVWDCSIGTIETKCMQYVYPRKGWSTYCVTFAKDEFGYVVTSYGTWYAKSCRTNRSADE